VATADGGLGTGLGGGIVAVIVGLIGMDSASSPVPATPPDFSRERCRIPPRALSRIVDACSISHTACSGQWLTPTARCRDAYLRWHAADRRNVSVRERFSHDHDARMCLDRLTTGYGGPIIQIPHTPSRRLWNATRRPSGDQANSSADESVEMRTIDPSFRFSIQAPSRYT